MNSIREPALRLTTNTMRTIGLLWFGAALLLMFSPGAQAVTNLQCAAQAGSVVINEINTHANFVELFIVQEIDIKDWALYVDANMKKELGHGNGTAYLPDGSTRADDAAPMPPNASKTTFPAGTYIVYSINMNPSNNEALLVNTKETPLKNNQTAAVDYLGYGNLNSPAPSWSVPTSCGATLPGHDANNQDIARLPNGSGAWGDNGNSNTTGSTNNLPATFDHIRIEHDSSGLTCAAETLTVKACANAACSTLYTASTVTGNVTWAGGNIPFTIAAGGTGQTTVNLTVPAAQTVMLGTSGISPAPGGASDCRNSSTNTLSCSLTFTVAPRCFDAVEVGMSAGTPIYTKLSGVPFSLDVRALTSGSAPSAFTGTVQVSLVDPTAASGNCADNNAGLNAVTSYTFSAADNNIKTFSFNYPNAARNVKVRIRDASVVAPGCSTDNFAIRPLDFTVASTVANADATGMSTTAAPAVKAGAGFPLEAAAVTGYDGTPQLDNMLVAEHAGAVAKGALSGMFGAASAATGVASGSGFSYSETGYFRLGVNGVYDNSFTAVDQPNDCTNDFSNALVAGKYGCKFGNTSNTSYFGRFTPDHFTTVVTQGCGAYTYSAQPFSVTVTALNAAGATTQNYNGAAAPVFAKNVTLTDGNDASVGSFGTTGSIAAAVFASGVAAVNTPAYSFTLAKTVPTTIRLRATESAGDGVTSAGFSEDIAVIRSGRLLLRSAYGSELLPLPMPLEAQFWQEGGNAAVTTDDYWTTNTLDSCTVIPAAAITLSNYHGNLNVGETSPAIGGAFAAGRGNLTLSAPGPGNNGSVDLTINSATAGVPWFGANPVARATFGLRKTPVIYLRENF